LWCITACHNIVVEGYYTIQTHYRDARVSSLVGWASARWGRARARSIGSIG
jgi:hypothetical protein